MGPSFTGRGVSFLIAGMAVQPGQDIDPGAAGAASDAESEQVAYTGQHAAVDAARPLAPPIPEGEGNQGTPVEPAHLAQPPVQPAPKAAPPGALAAYRTAVAAAVPIQEDSQDNPELLD